jgi:long-chain acyl-CoA synthetase
VGRQVVERRNRGQEVGGGLGIKYRLANKLVYSKLKEAIGLSRARICVSGAAPIASEVLEFFAGFDLVIHEVYGQSEDTGPTTFNLPGATRYGTVGKPIPGGEVKIAKDGEILFKGDNVFMGYFKDANATAETLEDGWLHSGDLGEFTSEGFLTITGRKKDIIITAGGKNIAPKNIEAALKNLPLISEAVVIGDRRKFLSALLTLDEEAAAAWASARGAATTDLHKNPDLIAHVQEGVDKEVNPQFAQVETVKKFTILHRQLTVEDGELTPTLKVKRKPVNEHFADEIEAMYAG